MKRVFKLQPKPHPSRGLAAQYCLDAPDGLLVTFSEPRRSQEASAAMWAKLHDIARCVDWYGKKLDATDWKHVFSSSLRKLEVVPNLDGTGFVALGLATSQMSQKEMSEMLTLIDAFGDEKGVKWSQGEL